MSEAEYDPDDPRTYFKQVHGEYFEHIKASADKATKTWEEGDRLRVEAKEAQEIQYKAMTQRQRLIYKLKEFLRNRTGRRR